MTDRAEREAQPLTKEQAAELSWSIPGTNAAKAQAAYDALLLIASGKHIVVSANARQPAAQESVEKIIAEMGEYVERTHSGWTTVEKWRNRLASLKEPRNG